MGPLSEDRHRRQCVADRQCRVQCAVAADRRRDARRACSPSRCRSIATSAATPIWRADSAAFSGSTSWSISINPISRVPPPNSGSAGTSACRAGCAIICTSRSAAIRQGKLKTYRNLMITMLLGGLWHGASWTFVAWGAFHGAILVVYHALHIDSIIERTRFATLRGFALNMTAWLVNIVARMHRLDPVPRAHLRRRPRGVQPTHRHVGLHDGSVLDALPLHGASDRGGDLSAPFRQARGAHGRAFPGALQCGARRAAHADRIQRARRARSSSILTSEAPALPSGTPSAAPAAARPARWRTALRCALLGVALLAYTLLFAEGFIRLFDPQAVMPRYITGTPWGVRGNIPHADYWHHTPEVDVEYRINGQGLRADRDYPLAKPPGVCRIAVFGDSFFFGLEADLKRYLRGGSRGSIAREGNTGRGAQLRGRRVRHRGDAADLRAIRLPVRSGRRDLLLGHLGPERQRTLRPVSPEGRPARARASRLSARGRLSGHAHAVRARTGSSPTTASSTPSSASASAHLRRSAW